MMSSTKLGMLSSYAIVTAFSKKLFLNVVYDFLAYCNDLITLVVLSQSNIIAIGAIPEWLIYLVPNVLYGKPNSLIGISLRLVNPGKIPVKLGLNSNAAAK